ncbi:MULTISPECIES: 2-octaprenyl-3-methyl-6-methoxy-1,4-benzoquinol hydroxylase [Vibrio]|uniref:2-octaprenyl-3-methyl-6-methoxy-1,4-benzoquinol hydroxylase n=4 Tax=Vibrio cyclitrophicus TaxID=47951 RepID=A0A7Z1S2X0_9VIBR|nr:MULTISPECIES: 2-octaprenyl-3-methyl-6-methoxy-1,4-benzoquinol hydroxylase [Vibrio]KNH10469.1 2-octaprenyl-3-methyl-6-methoxy-1,4-benzoquinol hydroxylase [Vibrio lentus]ERM61620.1 2-octaprenyl-3-methyl-6-methoxy-1,4-benzoquinol hydroxylase [Vibrio cyclitrophicus FF75]KAA8598535.1 2-polyprenyl-3-methyl-6-methoxy-14-benzoquinol hydroxylase [Vibrio cyclitrophicus]MBE8555748.1 2-octaprenyl-3-methyl-6-methoxy-1,4-benzoquinol hydroxylase [Vibrio sp. OPT24]MBE8607295.1 2-octaprenyl-3-methyl-6-metho
MNSYDIVVVGGGMVGAATAIGFAKQGLSVAVIEGFAPQAFDESQAMDIRVSAISQASVDLLEALGAWQSIAAMRVCSYKRLETWEHPECRTRFDAASLDLPRLGYIVENRLIQLGLWSQFDAHDNLELLCPEKLDEIEYGETNIVKLQSGTELSAKWVVGADGANSVVRQHAGIGITAWDYRQHCMLINVETEQPQQDITWQQFLPSGPRSFLPLCSLISDGQEVGQGSLVWYDSPSRIKQLSSMTPEKLRNEVLVNFPTELGDIKVLNSGSFPLTRRHAQSYSKNNCILVGDSAHTINPLAGQGVNLGFKDVSVLLDVTKEKGELNQSVARRYEVIRRGDNLMMQSGMDFFYKTFSNDIGPLKFVRNAALKLAENSGPIKTQVLKYALGL